MTSKIFSKNSRQATRSEAGSDYPIIVHSHLRWDWVWQRPQQFLSRFSKKHPVLFVEEPVPSESISASRAIITEPQNYPNVRVLRTELPSSLFANRASVDSEQKRLVEQVLAGPDGTRFQRPVQWFYDPMAAPTFVGTLDERLVVYDCMDQLSQFRGAPAELVRRERELLLLADVVFAGGPKIHSAKVQLNDNCHCFGCGVDIKHFGKARLPVTKVPTDIAALPSPRLGYFGVVDERLDYELIGNLADAHPDWSIVIVGPHTKVDPATFPRRTNLHWLGGRDYTALPGYVKGFDVCLMPFAINEATEYINPTKALEYMATGRPIVSTCIEDVQLQFSDIVHCASGSKSFIQACEAAISAPDLTKIQIGLERAKTNSWESIVSSMEGLIEDALAARGRSEVCAA